MRSHVSLLAALVVAGFLTAWPAHRTGAARADGDDEGPLREVPLYADHGGADVAAASAEVHARALRTITAIRASASPDTTAGEVRRLASLGPAALGDIAAALRESPWRVRSALLSAVAEMDAPQATPLLVQGSRDPAFAVREAAVVGLGKTGDTTGAAALLARTAADAEPAWRVRSAAATAIRRGILRGVVDRAAGGAALVRLMDDPDVDVARAALESVSPLALDAALTKVLAIFGDGARSARDRAQALSALRAFRTSERGPSDELIQALRHGFMRGADASEAVRAARTLIDLRGVQTLDDADVSASILRHLMDDASRDMRDAVVSLGPDAKPWLVEHLRDEANRVALQRTEPDESPFEPLLDALLQIDEAAGVDMLREVLAGPRAESLHRETRLLALRKAQFGFAVRMGPELRSLLRSRAGLDVYAAALRAIAASGGADVAGFVEAALRDARADAREAAIDVLNRFPEVPTPAALVELASSSTRLRERRQAIEALGRRDPAAGDRAARPLLTHPDPELRDTAISQIGAARDPASADVLRKLLRDEDGRSSEAARTADQPPAPPSATTESDTASTQLRTRRRLRAAILQALRAVAGPASRPDLLEVALRDDDTKARETAVQALRGIALAEDARLLVARLAHEPEEDVRTETRRLLATLGDAPEAHALFDRELTDAAARPAALRILAEPASQIVPDGLEKGLDAWSDDERASALRILERAGRRPSAPALAQLARSARTLDLVSEACRVLASDETPGAVAEISRLLDEEKDPARRALVVKAAGDRRAAALAPAIIALLDASRTGAIAADTRTSQDLQLYRDCALALGQIGTEVAGRALVEHMLDPQLAAVGAHRSVPGNGPFQPENGAVVTVIRTLVAAAAHVDDATLAGFIRESIERRAADGSQSLLDEEYLDGVARYLGDPMAYELPPRIRTAAALPLWRLVATEPPRWSPLDTEAWERACSELETQNRFAEARAALAASVAVAEVEDAARTVEDRRWEIAKAQALRAREFAAAGRADEAFALASKLREADAASADLSYLQGWCLVKIGHTGPEAADALRAALTRDARHANSQFYLAWEVERVEGAERAIPLYLEAIRIDEKRVEDLGRSEYLTNRRGRHHRWGHFFYWLARALASAGREEGLTASIRDAILLDDRYAARALGDPAFAGLADRAAIVGEAILQIPDAPLR